MNKFISNFLATPITNKKQQTKRHTEKSGNKNVRIIYFIF